MSLCTGHILFPFTNEEPDNLQLNECVCRKQKRGRKERNVVIDRNENNNKKNSFLQSTVPARLLVSFPPIAPGPGHGREMLALGANNAPTYSSYSTCNCCNQTDASCS
jgi:hypothetical protein